MATTTLTTDLIMTTIRQCVSEIINYTESLKQSTVLYGHEGTVVDKLLEQNILDGDADVRAVFQRVLEDAETETEFEARKGGCSSVWSHLHSIGLVNEHNVWILTYELAGLATGRAYSKDIIATSKIGLLNVINQLSTDFGRYAAFIYGFAYGRNSDAYNSTITPKGVVLSDRVVKVDADIISQLKEVCPPYSKDVTADTNATAGIEANRQSKMSKELGINPRSLRLTCLYLLKKEGLSWKDIEEKLDRKIPDARKLEVADLLK